MDGVDLFGTQAVGGLFSQGLTSGGLGSSILSGLSAGNPWVSIGATVLGGALRDTDTSGATAGGGQGQLNTSGWVVGDGEANGGSLTATPSIPWYAWASVAVLAVLLLRKKKGG